MTDFANKRWPKWLLLVSFAVLWFSTLGYRKLISPDEGRYAEIGREMLASGDWLTPRLNGIKYFEKPILQYWATATNFKLFGETEFAARLWPGLTGFIAVIALYFTAKRLFRRKPDAETRAIGAATILASSLWWIGNGHFLTLDMGVSSFLAIALFAFVWAQQDDTTPHENRNAMLVAWGAIALAIMSKGLIGLVFPGGTLLIYSLWTRDWKPWTRMHFVKGIALLLLISAPWFVMVSRANPEFAHFFFIHEHFQRFATDQARRDGAWYYFVPVLIAGMLPWAALLPQIFRTGWASNNAQRFQTQRFLFVWAVLIFAFFSKSHSKLPSYILPMFPALALLAGFVLTDLRRRSWLWLSGTMLALGVVLMVAAPFIAAKGSDKTPQIYNAAFSHWVLVGGIAITVLAALALWSALRRRFDLTLIALAATGLIGAQIPMLGHNEFAETNSSYHLIEAIKPQLKPGSTVYMYRYYDQTVPFYLKRPVQLVEYEDEFTLGQQQEPDKKMNDEDFLRHWHNDPAPVAITNPDRFRELQQQGLAMQIIASDPRRIVITRPASASTQASN
ncbi:phospholipid carrier-dependent glycosyltransferase [Jeongeupia wiesaeckerbachi]|uniref:phospholipid carrier-dependent glycosyltransferase n=1 Tax=Jeongeupia wiesaeckerbachi TaxID=3051218 RepID=UPI003D8071B8